MFGKNTLAILFAASTFAALPAFSQQEFYRQEVSGQAFGSFVKDTTQETRHHPEGHGQWRRSGEL